ncbi:MAG: hypothetical protein M0R30_10995 [Methanoregula sp.]|jgi:hypothetical protein|uniref:hypothetical protein n=1 Tax=Methanoregula sp. TaxID=2052170 RepID=UPI0025D23C99|nr:hypothetical protein [Methanoregula sp.]MCK9632155.1 hypothetical protein [Methanoregula sp.]
MHDLVGSRKMENGIVVFWDENGQRKNESFNYQELIDLKINAADLFDRPILSQVRTGVKREIKRK